MPTGRGYGRLLPYLLIGPALLAVAVVHVTPLALGVWQSLTLLGPDRLRDWTRADFAGIDNYRTVLDPSGPVAAELADAALRTAVFTVLVVGLSWSIGMLAAYLLADESRGGAALRALFLLPFALPAFASTIGWSFIFQRDTGAVNHVLVDMLGIVDERPFWLIGDNAFWVVVLVAAWRLWPFAFLVLLAALRSVPGEVAEAAVLDGTSRWQRFRLVTLPLIRPMNALVVLVMGLWSMNEFAVPYVIFGGSPPESATLLAGLVHRESFATLEVGLGAAMNVLILLGLVVVTTAYLRLVPLGRRRG